jgi:hypothetical protein
VLKGHLHLFDRRLIPRIEFDEATARAEISSAGAGSPSVELPRLVSPT